MSDNARISEGTGESGNVSAGNINDEAGPAVLTSHGMQPGAPGQRAFRERRRGRAPWLLVGIISAFLGGIAATIIAYPRIAGWWSGPVAVQGAAAPAAISASGASADTQPLNAARQDVLGARMTELEDRLARISVAAQAASGNATRAEDLLVAFAARRALDSGAPLGYVEGQLRLRFGQAQPRAVATIINAAREPVTLTDLQGGFADLAPSLATSPPGTSWWTAFRQEARNLVIIRKTTTPSPLPERTIPRIDRLLASGRVAPAMEEVARLPGKAAAERWLDMARRYREARRALDLIETAAILESPPVASPSVTVPAAPPVAAQPTISTPVE